jgi:hypothetical protein
VTLDAGDLNEMDQNILDYLAEGRATPTLIRRLLERDDVEVSRQYINQRMKRLAEHDHIENLLDTGVYELREDPREVTDG